MKPASQPSRRRFSGLLMLWRSGFALAKTVAAPLIVSVLLGHAPALLGAAPASAQMLDLNDPSLAPARRTPKAAPARSPAPAKPRTSTPVSTKGAQAMHNALQTLHLQDNSHKSASKTSAPTAGSHTNASEDFPTDSTSGTPLSMAKPLSVTVSKTLYLPPAMYGQWSLNLTLIETNAREYFSPTVNDIWILAREGDQVVISNPTNGASAAISVDRVEGNRATFYHSVPAGRNKLIQEIPTITVLGDTLTGQSINKICHLKQGAVTREYYAIYRLQAQRIGSARTRFRPEDEVSGPTFEIDEVHF